MAPKTIKMAILDALERLVDGNLEKFCSQLLEHKTESIRESWVMGKSRVHVRDVLVQTYTEEGAVEVVLETLRDADFNQIAKQFEENIRNLTKKKSKGGGASGAAASGHDLESEDCVDRGPHTNSEDPEKQLLFTEAQVGASNWKEFTPEVSASSGHILYRFRCPRWFYSTQTGLVLVVDGGAGLQYRTVQRDENLLESAGSEAAGPMLNIECPEDAVLQLHSPHCETAPGSGPTQSPEQRVQLSRVEFISRVSDPILHRLLDELLEKKVINHSEMELAQTLNRVEKARRVIDTMRKKGPEASSVLIAALCEMDRCLSRQLKLM